MNEDQLKVLTERLDQIQKVVNRIDEDQTHNTRDSQELTLRMGAVEGIVDQLKIGISRIPKKVSHAVEDAIQPAQKEVKDLRQVIEKKKTLLMKPLSFWQRWGKEK